MAVKLVDAERLLVEPAASKSERLIFGRRQRSDREGFSPQGETF
jgi:hypothetical protein